MALLRKGCFCCELRTCVLIQAWVSVLSSVLNITLGLFLFALMADLIPKEDLPEMLRGRPMSAQPGGRQAAASAIRTMKIQQGIGGATVLMTGLISLAISIALIYGCKKENRRLLVPALIWGMFSILFATTATIICVIATPAKIAAIVSFAAVPSLGFSVYCWLHILSYYQELREEDMELKRQTL